MKISYMLKASISIFLFLCISLSSYSFRLDNIYYNQRIDGEDGGYREFYIVNQYLQKQRYKINILPGNDNDGSKFVEVYPKVITVDPKGKGTVKVFMKAPKGTKIGEYKFNLQFQPINIPTLAKNKDGLTTGTANINIAPVIELKGYVGDVDFSKVLDFKDLKIEYKENKGVVVTGKISNNSHAGIDFGAEAYGKNEFFYGSDHVGHILGNTKDKDVTLVFPTIKKESDLKKILFYRTPSDTREVLKEINIKN